MIYLDYNATAPIRPEIISLVTDVMSMTGNASSVHQHGRSARRHIEQARNKIADCLGVYAAQIVFTSGGTESNNAVLSGQDWDVVLTPATEHDAVLQAKAPLELLPVDVNGIVKFDVLEALLKKHQGQKILVSVMYGNNETGVIQPLKEIADLARTYGAMFHSDAVQILGKKSIDYDAIQPDFLSFSSHKLGGPQGVGAIIVKNRVTLQAWVKGGGQEQRRRSGTENVAGIAGFGEACKMAYDEMTDLHPKLTSWRKEAENRLVKSGALIFGDKSDRLGHVINLAMPKVRSQTQLMSFDLEKISISTGSACSSGKVKSSHVLAAMGVAPEIAECAIRMSMGWNTKKDDVDAFCSAWEKIYQKASR